MADAEYDDWLAAIGDGDGYYLACPDGHGSLPPRRSCPHCGAAELTEEPLQATGELVTYSEVHVPAPRFADDAPYVTAIATFGPVRLTGIVRDIESADIELGMEVVPDVGESVTTGDTMLVFRPTDA